MSPFLETWEHQKTCACGEQLCFIQGVPTESDGSDHRFKCPHYLKHKRQTGAFPKPVPEKPINPTRALEHEKQHEGQTTLEAWCR